MVIYLSLANSELVKLRVRLNDGWLREGERVRMVCVSWLYGRTMGMNVTFIFLFRSPSFWPSSLPMLTLKPSIYLPLTLAYPLIDDNKNWIFQNFDSQWSNVAKWQHQEIKYRTTLKYILAISMMMEEQQINRKIFFILIDK